MSSTSFRGPDLRLNLGYPLVTLTSGDGPVPLATAIPDAPGFLCELRRLGRAVARTPARLTVVLPQAEVWRGKVALPRTLLGRRRAARAAAASALAARPGDVAIMLGPQTGGLTPVAAVRRTTLADARRLLAGAGLRPDAIEAAGAFPGFAAPPHLVDSGPGLPRVAMVAAAAVVVAGASAFVLWPPAPAEVAAPPPVTAEPAAPEVPAPAPDADHTALPAPRRTLALLRAESPPPRPEPQVPRVLATLATRNAPLVIVERRDGMSAELRLAELTTTRARMMDASFTPVHRPEPSVRKPDVANAQPAPRHRPASAAARPAETVAAAPAAEAAPAPGKPRPRPATAAAPAVPVRVASLQPTAIAVRADAGPALPPARPAAPKQAAAADPAPAAAPAPVKPSAAAGLAAAVAALPPARPAAAKPKPVVARATPAAPKATVRQAAVRPKAVAAPAQVRRAPAPAPTVVRASPAPAKVAVRTAPAKPKVATVRRAPAAATTRPAATRTASPSRSLAAGFASAANRKTGRGNVTLIGVFGGSSDRHALVRLPNGDIARVRAGDSVRGAQVAAVGADSVRLLSGGRETLLTLPD